MLGKRNPYALSASRPDDHGSRNMSGHEGNDNVERHCNWRGAGSRKRFMSVRTLTQQFLDCVTSQVITIDDLTSDVAGIARGAVSLCRAEAHAAAVSKAGSQNELVPNLRAGLEASGIETGYCGAAKTRPWSLLWWTSPAIMR
jgi:hypothetical protein